MCMGKIEFGKLVNKLRNEKGIKLRKFAEMVGVSPTYISKIERGDFEPPKEDRVKKMAEILDYDPDKLLSEADKADSDLVNKIINNPGVVPAFLRTVSIKEMEKILKDKEIKGRKDGK